MKHFAAIVKELLESDSPLWAEGQWLIRWASLHATTDEKRDFAAWYNTVEDLSAMETGTPQDSFPSCPFSWDEIRQKVAEENR